MLYFKLNRLDSNLVFVEIYCFIGNIRFLSLVLICDPIPVVKLLWVLLLHWVPPFDCKVLE